MLIEKLTGEFTEDLTINKDLLNRDEDGQNRIRLSGLGKDIQWQYMDIISDEKEEIDDRLHRIFNLGHILEQYVFAQLSTHIYAKDKIVKTGILDHNGEEIKGELDCKYKDEHGTEYIVDVKTMSSSSFGKLVDVQDIKKTHYMYYVQLQMYMHFEGVQDSFILAYNKDNSEMAEVFAAYDAEFVSQQLNRIEILKHHLMEQKEPELEYPRQRNIKTRKVRNKEEYVGTGVIIDAPHPKNRFNPYIDTEAKTIDAPETEGVIYSERDPLVN